MIVFIEVYVLVDFVRFIVEMFYIFIIIEIEKKNFFFRKDIELL